MTYHLCSHCFSVLLERGEEYLRCQHYIPHFSCSLASNEFDRISRVFGVMRRMRNISPLCSLEDKKTRRAARTEHSLTLHNNEVGSGRVFTSGSTENSVKTVPFPSRLKLSESANFNRILIKFKPQNQIHYGNYFRLFKSEIQQVCHFYYCIITCSLLVLNRENTYHF